MRLVAILAAALLPLAPALAEPADDAGTITVTGYVGITAAQRRVPTQLTPAQRSAYRAIFLAIDAGRFSAAESALAALPDGPLHATARAQLILARGPGRSGIAADWLAQHTDLPQAPRLVALAARGAGPVLPLQKTLRTVSFQPAMGPAATRGSARDDAAIARLKPLLAADRNAEAEAVLTGAAAQMSPDVASEYYERIAWSYYGAGDDFAAERMGKAAATGSSSWSGLGGWVAGLAAYRRGDCAAAADSFDKVAARFGGEDYAPAANFWAARAYLACGKPALVASRLQSAAAHPDSFYGMLARRTLGLAQSLDWAEPDFITADWNHLSDLPGARRAAALVEIGEIGLADRELKYLAATADAGNYPAILRLAARLNLPATQFWLAHHPPEGIDPPLSARYPAPEWNPAHGWRVDKGLVFAHALQESNFVTSATSRVGAKGVMQLMPATARRVQARMADGTVVDAAVKTLDDPEFNIDCGQAYMQELRDTSYTAGLLPKVIAAYNAGPGSVQKWNATVRDNGDPLLFIESIPFRETRHYVEVVLRNYWMYQLRDGHTPPSIDALAAGLWPKFPGLPGPAAVTVTPTVTAPLLPLVPPAPVLPDDTTAVASTF
ncbi:MAG: lytic transglycosylase domain-containing protein [Sphingomonadaceae bacterium]|nr:lytic transglycosylase domain-containing protein [Sphingomonadaceae bacterium]